jgi:hypothetical protein
MRKDNLVELPLRHTTSVVQPPPNAPVKAGIRPAARMLECRSLLVIRQVIETRDARVVARRHGVGVSEVIGLMVDHIQDLRGELRERRAA